MSSSPRSSHSPPTSRPGTAGASPWVPAGVRPHTIPNQHTTPVTGTRRNRAVERTHAFIDARELSPRDPANYFWMYGAYEYRLQTPHEEAKTTCFRMIDRLVEKIQNWYDASPPLAATVPAAAAGGGGSFAVDGPGRAARSTSIGSMSDTSINGTNKPQSSSNVARGPKAHLIVDLISTKKHIGAVPEEGLPYRLGHDIYRYVDTTYGSMVATTFVGLTDNTARRVGRDVYYTKSDDLSRTHYGFHTVDREHLFIVFPPKEELAPSGGAEAASE